MPETSELMRQSFYLHPGGVFAAVKPHLVTTVLGSCVSVCLWDRVMKIGGINHFLLPLWNGEGLSTPRYGNIAIINLIKKLEEFGSHKDHLIAKIFGGAALWAQTRGLMAIGQRNVDLARELLHEHDIPLLASDVGGEAARKIIFNTGNGNVLLRRTRKALTPDKQITPPFGVSR